MPSEAIIIADSSPLIGLARIGKLHLLPLLAARIVVPPAVWHEVTTARSEAPGAIEVARQEWIEKVVPASEDVEPLLILVGRGEAEAIALAQKKPGAVLLLDDLRARKLAARLHLRRFGTVALLGRAKKAGLIDKLKPCLDSLQSQGIHISKSLVEASLREVGE